MILKKYPDTGAKRTGYNLFITKTRLFAKLKQFYKTYC